MTSTGSHDTDIKIPKQKSFVTCILTKTTKIDFNQFSASNTVMLQGCTSDAGKSVITAGLCRLLRNKGIAVAPFKPQNMALNSAVTSDGGEIGRAQALQAFASGLEPHTDMNPILLKPTSDQGAQVIVQGKALSNMEAKGYHDYKKVAMNAVIDSFDRLNSQYDAIMVEGAGSPAEINLREGDIANMGFAERVDCPVVIIADIDRGGVFAHLVGTLELLSKSEQKRVIGFIINKFRGDIALLEPGIDWLEEKTNKPVLGVLPYLKNLFLDAEDAINIEQNVTEDALTVLVPVLPRISNHTDFDALRLNPDVNLKFVSIESHDRKADLIILPGSKNVIADLDALHKNGWKETLEKHLRYGGKLLGICGGYQMLGQHIDDPMGVESAGSPSSITGFSLLPIKTKLEESKQLKNITARFDNENFNSASVQAYEIHCGQSEPFENDNATSVFKLEDGTAEGFMSKDCAVLGTYLHGLFDQADACQQILNWAGVDSSNSIDVNSEREKNLDRLALALEKHLKPEFLTSILQCSQKHPKSNG